MSRKRKQEEYLTAGFLRALGGGKTNGALLAARGALLVGADVLFIAVERESQTMDLVDKLWRLTNVHTKATDEEVDEDPVDEIPMGNVKIFVADEFTFQDRDLVSAVKLTIKEIKKNSTMFDPKLIVIDDIDGVTGRAYDNGAAQLSAALRLPVFYTASMKPSKKMRELHYKTSNTVPGWRPKK